MGKPKAEELVGVSESSTGAAPQMDALFDALPCPIYYQDNHGRYLGCNQVFADRIIGAPIEQIVGRSSEELAPLYASTTEPEPTTHAAPFDTIGDGISEVAVRCADGNICLFAIHQSTYRDSLGNPAGVVGIMLDLTSVKAAENKLIQYRDQLEEMVSQRSAEMMAINNRLTREIEERQRVESALQASEERYRRVFDNTGTATILVEPDLTISMANAMAEKLVGMPREQFLERKRLLDFITPEYRDRIRLYHEMRMQEDPKVPKRYDFQIVNRRGDIREVLATSQRIPDTRQTVISMLDITERKKMLQESKRLAAVIDQSTEAVIITDNHGRVQYANKAFETLSGFQLDESIGQSMEAPFFCDQDREILQQMTFMVSGDDNWSGRVKNIRNDGSTYIADTHIFPICDDKGKAEHLVCIKTDVTHEVQLEKQLQHSQKMEAIGTLAGGIAHDFNNILGGILGYAEISMIRSGGNQDLKRNLGRILEGCQRAKELVQNILAFSRKKDEETKPIEVQIILKEALKLLRASIPSTVEFRQHIATEASIVQATPTQLHQVAVNLCTNASHAMSKMGGELKVRLENIEMTPEACRETPELMPGPYVLLTVSDTGEGMPPETMERIFEPYYTTKEQTGGTGLGLSVVHGIVTNLGGRIEVTSRVGAGSTFRVYIPKVDDAIEPGKPKPEEPPRGRERILVVDDEQFILEIMDDMLASLGYTVQTVESGLKALQLFKEDPSGYDLVIADLTMPKMTGKQLAEEIRKVRKGMPIILTTGLNVDAGTLADEYHAFAAVLNKPILYSDLAKTLRKILDTSPG